MLLHTSYTSRTLVQAKSGPEGRLGQCYVSDVASTGTDLLPGARCWPWGGKSAWGALLFLLSFAVNLKWPQKKICCK